MNVVIREFQPGDEAAFRAINEAWIAKYFQIEPHDREILEHSRESILEHGGHIYFAVNPENGERLGCCALIAMEPGVFELAKMAVAEPWRGKGVGRQLLRGVIDAARSLGASRLYLESNHTLTNAIALYLSEGFHHLRSENGKPSPYARATVFMEKYL